MSIKSRNIPFNLIPTPPEGYTYIGTDDNSNFCMKLDNGEIRYISGVGNLSDLNDVLISSGITSVQLLMWNGSKWVNSTVNIDLSSIESSISSESSTRIVQVSSLETVIDNIPTGTTFDPSSLETSLSSESSTRLLNDSSLETKISAETSTRTVQVSSLSSSLSSEISTREQTDFNISTELSLHKHTTLYDQSGNPIITVNDIYTSITRQLRIENIDQMINGYSNLGITTVSELTINEPEITLKSGSLENKISFDFERVLKSTDKNGFEKTVIISDPTVINNGMFGYWNDFNKILEFKNIEISDINNLSSTISAESSTRTVQISSLETVIGNIPTGTTFDPSSLETSISAETSSRILGDSSLETLISTEINLRTSGDSSLSSIVNSHTSTLSELGTISSKDYWTGTQSQYDALGSYDSNTLYFITT